MDVFGDDRVPGLRADERSGGFPEVSTCTVDTVARCWTMDAPGLHAAEPAFASPALHRVIDAPGSHAPSSQKAAPRSGSSSRLRDEYGLTATTIVRTPGAPAYRVREMFVPFPCGPRPVRFPGVGGDAGVERWEPCWAPQRCFVKAYPGAPPRPFMDGHVSAFALGKGSPRSIAYDNTSWRSIILGHDAGSAPGPSPSCSPTTCSRIGRPGKGQGECRGDGPARRLGTSWCRYSAVSFQALNATWRGGAWQRLPRAAPTHSRPAADGRDLDALLPFSPA